MTERVLFIFLVEGGGGDACVLDCDVELCPPTIDDEVCGILENLLPIRESNLLL